MGLRSELNRHVPPATPGEFDAPRIGPLEVWPPVVLAPMAGVTNAPFRSLCREFGAGLYVSEMVTARGLVDGHLKTTRLAHFDPDESPRSIQLYGTEPESIRRAVDLLVGEGRVDHIDMNFGCPMPKVTRRGGGAAIPLKPRLFEDIVRAAVDSSGDVPVTVKFRKGTDDDPLTFLEAGRIAEAVGAAAVSLHARTAEQLYSGEADWSAVADLKAAVTGIPVFGNGDVWEPWDALRLMRTTGCDGVVVGRGCLGRPWLFGDLAAAFRARARAGAESDASRRSDASADEAAPRRLRHVRIQPNLGEVADAFRRHAELLVEFFDDEVKACRDIRKHVAWYMHGFPAGADLRRSLALVKTISELDALLDQLDPEVLFPDAANGPRGRQGSPASVSLPEGWLDDPDDCAVPAGAEMMHSGG